MFDRESRQQTAAARSHRHGRPARLAIWAAVVTVALVASFAAIALASGSGTTVVGAATNARFGSEKIVVDAHGRTLYVLSPETAHHLLCKGSECLNAWPPLTVHSRKVKLTDGPGVHGRLGILRRGDGMLQVTLGGLPLYRFSGDSAKGAANGEGIKSFGGTWHVLAAGTDAAPVQAPASAPTSAEPTPGYPSAPAASTPAPAPTPTTSTPATTTPMTPTTPTTTTTTPAEPPYYPPGY